jgi:UDP-N-acetylmuramyl pentapeptide phosphotransferase/UDP-N-acetylglucosamine-1-phosphate transferase
MGVRDDVLGSEPLMKFFVQIVAATLVVWLGDLRITDFHGFFGLHPNYLTSVAFSVVFIIFLINGFNLIDGVDGLAATTGIIVTASFSFWHIINGELISPLLGAMIVGALVAFLYYNLFSKRQKIFMGDTGSLIVGFLVSIMAIRFMELNASVNRSALEYKMGAAPAVAMGIMIVPIIDTISVFFRRIRQGRSPFAADKAHIHHRLLTLGLSHWQITAVLGSVNLIFVFTSYLLKDVGMLWLLSMNLIAGFMVFSIPSIIIRMKIRKIKADKSYSDS